MFLSMKKHLFFGHNVPKEIVFRYKGLYVYTELYKYYLSLKT